MFFIHTLEGLYRDMSLEELIHKAEIHGIQRGSRTRRIIRGHDSGERYGSAAQSLSYAEKSYRESINLKNEFEPLLHAWQIMSSPVRTINPAMRITDAWNISKHEGICHFPVVSDDKKLEGIISDRDILKRLLISDDRIINRTDETVADIMIREVITANRMTDIRRIALVMFSAHVGSMPILDDDRELAGIITRSDILHALINYPPLKLWG